MYLKKSFNNIRLNPPQVLAIGFMFIIIMGALILNLGISSSNGKSIGFLNALFTSASAVCVTGLSVINSATDLSLFGQVVLVSLIQIGGLGIMTLATIGFFLIGKRITFKERLIIKEQLNTESLTGIVKLTMKVIKYTFILEFTGALLLSFRFIPVYGIKKGLWFSIFHSISAFCNAGFDIIGNSLLNFQKDYFVLFIISILVILGGLGFSVYTDLINKDKIRRLNLHSKLVLFMTATLLIYGFLSFMIFEYNNPSTIGNMNFIEKVVNSFFQSVVPRTAGFYSVNFSSIKDASLFTIIILMFIGGSPGSTAGGVKTTTFACLLFATISIIKGENDVNVMKRRLSIETVKRAISILLISLMLVYVASLTLTLTEKDFRFIDLLFEATSAFGTVGLSVGITPKLSIIGRLIIIFTMYIGRVGPLTMAYAFAKKNKKRDYRNAPGNIMVG